jgi:hypothetical protein
MPVPSLEPSDTTTTHLRFLLNQFLVLQFSSTILANQRSPSALVIYALYERQLPTNKQLPLASLGPPRATARFEGTPVLFVTLALIRLHVPILDHHLNTLIADRSASSEVDRLTFKSRL